MRDFAAIVGDKQVSDKLLRLYVLMKVQRYGEAWAVENLEVLREKRPSLAKSVAVELSRARNGQPSNRAEESILKFRLEVKLYTAQKLAV